MTEPRPEPRWNLIAHLREQIAAGTYATKGKLGILADRLLEELARQEDRQR